MRWLIAIVVLVVALAVAAFVVKRNADERETRALAEKFAPVVAATAPYRLAVELCARYGTCIKAGRIAGLREGTHGIPDSASGPVLAGIVVAADGTITARAVQADGLNHETYVLTPGYVPGQPLAWQVGGTCRMRPAGAIC